MGWAGPRVDDTSAVQCADPSAGSEVGDYLVAEAEVSICILFRFGGRGEEENSSHEFLRRRAAPASQAAIVVWVSSAEQRGAYDSKLSRSV